jgi:cation transporter-like permease
VKIKANLPINLTGSVFGLITGQILNANGLLVKNVSSSGQIFVKHT